MLIDAALARCLMPPRCFATLLFAMLADARRCLCAFHDIAAARGFDMALPADAAFFMPLRAARVCAAALPAAILRLLDNALSYFF